MSGGSLRTPAVTLAAGSKLHLNAHVAGEARVRVLDQRGAPIPGFDAADCAAIRGDSLRHAVEWERPLATGAALVQLEIVMREAKLFALEVE